jgi:D-3-phosphoglycerate dehydrogenase
MVCVLVCDELDGRALTGLEQAGFTVESALGWSETQRIERAQAGVDALLVRSATKVTRTLIENSRGLRLIGRAGVGVDNVDVAAASEHGVLVINAPEGNTIATAELTIAQLFACARKLPQAYATTRAGSWDKRALMGTQISGATLGVVGLGHIGRAVAQRARGLGMRVLGYDPLPPREPGGVELCALETLLAQSDFVTLHVPFSEATRHLISRERLLAMKRGARLINCARGGLVDERALLECLDSGHIAAAALDVLEGEPPQPAHPLLSRSEIAITPHIGASTRQAQAAVALEIAQGVLAFFLERRVQGAVNLAEWERSGGWTRS